MTAEHPQGDEPLIPMPALSLPALRQAVTAVAPSRLSGIRQSGKPPRSSRRPTARSRVPDWHWEPVTDDLLDELPPAALATIRQVAEDALAHLDLPSVQVRGGQLAAGPRASGPRRGAATGTCPSSPGASGGRSG
jgi:hypothetical protein